MKKLAFLSSLSRHYSIHRFPFNALVDENRAKNGTCRNCQKQDIFLSRSFLDFGGRLQDTKKEYSGKKLVGYSMEQMFDVVSDVEHYNKFIPFCKKSNVNLRTSNHLKADLVIGFPPIVEKYTSNVVLVKPSLVKAICTDGKLFNHLLTIWKFSPGLKNNLQTSIIDFFVSFEFKSTLHSQLAHVFFNELVRQMEGAFYEEAKLRYGQPSIKTQHLTPHRDIS